ncbi:MAG: hypothetical protein LAT62_05005 [Natronospirillum sp.]|uniref:FliH/SctL family protein n=1 Tax=Natronospirillum sp. TaxID=2812955 RepID=UPI0025CEFA0E|nr:FliH/SctL family protein [Natronospirillum sp.]MCH8551274.1 hypothetical protein [Natronospirillum sp.]
MAVNRKGFTNSEKLEVRSWQLPDLEGLPVNEEDALGNRAARNAHHRRRREDREPPAQETSSPAEPDLQPPSAAELQAIRAAAREEGFAEGCKAGYEEGHAEGYETGYAAGRSEGLAAGQEEGHTQAKETADAELKATLDDLTQRFGAAIQTLNEHETSLEQELAPVLRDLVLRLTQGLVVQALQQTPEQIEDIVHQAIQLMPPAHERMQIFLHPDDCSMLKGQGLHWLEKVDLQPDNSLSPGGCQIKTRHSLLDYSLDERYQRQIQALLEMNNGFATDEPPEPLRQLSAERFQALLDQEAPDDRPAPREKPAAAEAPSEASPEAIETDEADTSETDEIRSDQDVSDEDSPDVDGNVEGDDEPAG